jgi:hypothetical protein
MFHDVVVVDQGENGDLIAAACGPGVVGEVLILDREAAGSAVDAKVRVLESSPIVVDGAIRHRLRLEEVQNEADGNTMGVLTREIQVSMLNFSHSGSLLESRVPVAVGTVGTVHLAVGGTEYIEDVQVVRCKEIQGSGSRYHIGARFLWTSLRRTKALRRLMTKHVGQVSTRLVERKTKGKAV